MKYLKQLCVAFCLFVVTTARADEGMWLPLLLEKMNEKEMKSLGMKISAKDIYNINAGSLKDAIVSFGGFCTGEVISQQGLVLTNHHCGFNSIQNHSTLQNNYIRDGFWAANQGQEIPNPGLFVTFIVRIEDVTKAALNGVTSAMSEPERQSAIDRNLNEIRKNVKREEYQDGFIRPFFEGNQYYLFVTETYNDVRLVGAPPSSIGNFGKDTDNWMWPRHTGDFSMFRIYAGKGNKPAAFSKDNVPYKPKKSLAISLDGVAENDFTMVFGFPGTTNEYLHSAAVEQIMTVNDPAKISIRDKTLSVIDGFMRKDEQIKIQYAAKYASIQNYHKKWQGEVLGLTLTDAVGKKKKQEQEFQKRVNANPEWKTSYGNLLGDLASTYAAFKPYGLGRDYFSEIIGRVELYGIIGQLNVLITTYEREGAAGYAKKLPGVKEIITGVFDEYNVDVDKKLFEELMTLYVKDQAANYVAPMVTEWMGNDIKNLSAKAYADAGLFNSKSVMTLLDRPAADVVAELKSKPIIALYNDIYRTYQGQVQGKLGELQAKINGLQRTYMKAQMDVMKERKFYPDANRTFRVTYGKVKGYSAKDAVKFDYYTYLDGVMEKYKPADYEFDVPEKLKELYQKKDYGVYGAGNKMPVCFIAANHTTGGNSGSPALDAYGNLVGLNFDRVWEGTMSDINYDPSICRNIMVDIRYVLFIVDKYAGASHLVKEMKLVHPKKSR